MELKIQVHTITVKDEDSGEQKVVSTVRTVEEIAGHVEESEGEALENAVYRLKEQY